MAENKNDEEQEALEEWGVDREDDNGRHILRRLASSERMTLDILRRATATLQPADRCCSRP